MKSQAVTLTETSTRAKPARARCGAPVAGLVCLALVLVGCDFPGQRSAQIRVVPADEVLGFDALYATNCAGCHGPDGRLGPAPPLNDPLFLKIVPDAVVQDVIRDGRPATLMPAFSQDKGGTLTARQMQVLTTGLKNALEAEPKG